MDYHNFITLVEKRGEGGLGFSLSGEQRSQFREMGTLYGEWNAKVNLISRKDIDNLYSHHVLHSLLLAAFMKSELTDDFAIAVGDGGREVGGRVDEACSGGEVRKLRFLDVGTGGGFPGIPLAVMFPNAHFTLCDSIAKKTKVVSDISSRLGLGNVEVVNARAEELTDTYDYVVSRAAASLEELLGWTDGRFGKGLICLKGGDVAREAVAAARRFHLGTSSFHIWGIENLLDDEYFKGKFVIFYKNFCK